MASKTFYFFFLLTNRRMCSVTLPIIIVHETYINMYIWWNKSASIQQILDLVLGLEAKKVQARIAKRANPIQWVKCITASTSIKMFNNSNASMALELREISYINERTPGRATFICVARRIPGKQYLWNRLEVLMKLKFGLINIKNDDILRVELKKEFFMFWFLSILSWQLRCAGIHLFIAIYLVIYYILVIILIFEYLYFTRFLKRITTICDC